MVLKLVIWGVTVRHEARKECKMQSRANLPAELRACALAGRGAETQRARERNFNGSGSRGAVRGVGFRWLQNGCCITRRPARTERKAINIKMGFVGTFGRAQGLPAELELARGRQARKKCK